MMVHLGDICKIDGAKIPFVDVVTGGSPCQDLSIAGKRAGLAGERSGLFMEQIRVIKEMREASGTTCPRYMVWENVPGAFSSNKGKDFAAVLEETIRISEPEAPDIDVPAKGWPTWGCFRDVDGRWSVAWRTLDAQYWGVPQRRRRIALVADFRGGSAPEILFERKGVSGNPETCRETREGAAAEAEGSTCASSYALRIRGGCEGGGKGPLVQIKKSGTLGTGNDQTIFAFFAGQGAKAGGIGYQEECSPTLKASESGTNRTPCICVPINDKATRYKGGGATRNQDGSGNGLGIGKDGDPSPTLTNMETYPVLEGFVRRFTPLECERLQGYPDGWTNIGEWYDSKTGIGYWYDSKGKRHKTADSPRYKALGNSIALPPWRFVLRRIYANLPQGASLGSLFDGIGGFPLIWRELGGIPVWASEIEEFTIAVTKRRFWEV